MRVGTKGKDPTGQQDPGSTYLVPQEGLFKGEDGEALDFIPAPDLEKIAAELIGRHGRFAEIEILRIAYLWKRKGGVSKGKRVLGKTQKPTGLLRYFSEFDFTVWLARDHAYDLGPTHRQIEAAVFHELLHIAYDPEDGRVFLVDHDFEGFTAEIETYGTWQRGLTLAKEAFQLALPLGKTESEVTDATGEDIEERE